MDSLNPKLLIEYEESESEKEMFWKIINMSEEDRAFLCMMNRVTKSIHNSLKVDREYFGIDVSVDPPRTAYSSMKLKSDKNNRGGRSWKIMYYLYQVEE